MADLRQARRPQIRLPTNLPIQASISCLIALLALLLVGCTLPEALPAPLPLVNTPTPMPLPERCQGDGVVQTWLLLPLDPPESELLSAYQDRQIIEFQATVSGGSDDPANLPHRTFILNEVAEGITLTLDYTGDPPPLMMGQSYRFVAWADLMDDGPPAAGEPGDPTSRPAVPASRSYALQVFDQTGLLFLGATDADLRGDPLAIAIESLPGDCPPVAEQENSCVVKRQVQPLRLRWGDQEVTLYPGEDTQIVHAGSLYQVSVFRNRLVREAEPACESYHEHTRSLRIERLQPPPLPPILSEDAITVTTPITARLPITVPAP